MAVRVVVLGGAGNFGARIVRALQGDPSTELIAAGRRAIPVSGAEAVTTASLDIAAADFTAQLAALTPGLVIHCVGPFQGQDYRVAQASLAAGAHYLDIADGREFVAQFSPAMQSLAEQTGLLAISGASTLPAFSWACIDSLQEPLKAMHTVEIAIAPGQRAPRGLATLAAVLSYLGRPVAVWRGGRWRTGWGWMNLKRIHFAFGTRWGALCDVPDLALLPECVPTLREVRFHAALEFGVQHLALWLLAALRRVGLPLPVQRWAGGLNRCAGLFDRFGGDWGGMRVSVVGVHNSGSHVRRSWQIQAPALQGPEIPCLAAILLARRIARGELCISGAFPCLGFLSLADFAPELASRGITAVMEESPA